MAKRIPSRLKIGPHDFTVRRCSPEEMGAPSREYLKQFRSTGTHYTFFGSMCYADLDIMLNRKMKDSVAAETLLHEVLHAAVEIGGIHQHLKKGREEAVVQTLAAILTQVLHDNVSLRRLFA